MDAQTTSRTVREISDWLVAYVARLLEFEPDEVKTGIPLSRYGLDSIAAAGLTGELSTWLGMRIDARALYEHRTIAALAQYLAATLEEQRAGASA